MQHVIRLCCVLWEQQMAYLDQITCAPYLKCRIHSKCSHVSRKLFVHMMNVPHYNRTFRDFNTHLCWKLALANFRAKILRMVLYWPWHIMLDFIYSRYWVCLYGGGNKSIRFGREAKNSQFVVQYLLYNVRRLPFKTCHFLSILHLGSLLQFQTPFFHTIIKNNNLQSIMF